MPTARTIDHVQGRRIADDIRLQVAARAAQAASERYAVLLRGSAADLIAASLPSAHTLMFDRDHRDGVTDITLLTIRDHDGVLLWHGEDFYQPTPAEIDRGVAALADEVIGAVTEAICEAYDCGFGYGFDNAQVDDPNLLGMHLLELVVPDAVRAGRAEPPDARCAGPDTGSTTRGAKADSGADVGRRAGPLCVGLDVLAEILTRETRVMDPADVGPLMTVIRAAAHHHGSPGRLISRPDAARTTSAPRISAGPFCVCGTPPRTGSSRALALLHRPGRTSAMTTPLSTITIGTPAEVVGIVPYVLGFHPADSLVCLALTGTRVLFGLRTDVQTDPDGSDTYRRHMDGVAARLVDHHATGAVLVGYGQALPAALSVTAARAAFAAAGVPVRDVQRVADGRVWSLTCTDPRCCPPEGVPFDPRASVSATEATLAGLVAMPDRDAVAQQLAPITGAARAAFRTATDAAVDRLLAQIEGLPADVNIDDDAVLQTTTVGQRLVREGRQLLTTGVDVYRDGGIFDDERAALLTVLMQLSGVRDVAVVSCTADDWQISMWMDLLRRVEPAFVPGPAVLLTICALLAGNGALASCAVTRALDADPEYLLGQQLADVIRTGISPSELAALLCG